MRLLLYLIGYESSMSPDHFIPFIGDRLFVPCRGHEYGVLFCEHCEQKDVFRYRFFYAN